MHDTTGHAQPTFSFAKFCAQFSHSWKVPVHVKPIRIIAMDSKEKCVCFRLSISPSFLPAAIWSASGSGKRNTSNEEYKVDDSTSIEQTVVGSKSCSSCSYGCSKYEWKQHLSDCDKEFDSHGCNTRCFVDDFGNCR